MLQAYSTGTLGNALMLTHFVTQREHNALRLQLLGIASNLLVLSQVARPHKRALIVPILPLQAPCNTCMALPEQSTSAFVPSPARRGCHGPCCLILHNTSKVLSSWSVAALQGPGPKRCSCHLLQPWPCQAQQPSMYAWSEACA